MKTHLSRWKAMKNRCYNENSIDYPNYGGRGIKVCDEWLHDFQKYADYIGPKPAPNYQLDRIDNNGNYEPGNVRWVDKSTQMINRRIQRNNTSGHKGVSQSAKTGKWWAQISVIKSERI